MSKTLPEVKEMKSAHGYTIRYHRFHNDQQNSDVVMIWTYYKGKYVECVAYANGKRLSI